MIQALYKPLSIIFGILGGLVAGSIFEQVWKRVGQDRPPPDPKREDQSWGEIIPAVALQGAIFAVVRALIAKGAAEAFRKQTGVWPGTPAGADD